MAIEHSLTLIAYNPRMSPDSPVAHLEPLPYQQRLRAFLKDRQPQVWDWFASEEFHHDDAEAVRLELLKATYRLDREPHAELYGLADRVLDKLGLQVPITLYQNQKGEQEDDQLNAFVAYVRGHSHIHVVFTGAILRLLNTEETTALLGHELAHYLLWDAWDHEYFIAQCQVRALAEDPRAETSHEETARLQRLYTEIFADRGGLLASGDLQATVAMLVKVMTGLEEVSATSYLNQADEIFEHQHAGTQELTHPEAYIRARALRLWYAGRADAEDEIARMIHGPAALDRLDLLAQAHWTELTRRLIRFFLSPAWFQTEAVLAHARHFFDDFAPAPGGHRDEQLFTELQVSDPGLRDYICYLMVDFIALARELEEAPIVAGFALANRIGAGDRLKEVLAKELRITKRQLEVHRQEAAREAEER